MMLFQCSESDSAAQPDTSQVAIETETETKTAALADTFEVSAETVDDVEPEQATEQALPEQGQQTSEPARPQITSELAPPEIYEVCCSHSSEVTSNGFMLDCMLDRVHWECRVSARQACL